MEDAWESVPQDLFSQNVVCWNGIDSWDMWNVGKHILGTWIIISTNATGRWLSQIMSLSLGWWMHVLV
jgi:hypothetical protein